MKSVSLSLRRLVIADKIAAKKNLLNKLDKITHKQTDIRDKFDTIYRSLMEDFKDLAKDLGQEEIVKQIEEEQIDFECVPIVVALNTIPGLYASGMSGNGSEHYNYYVWFKVTDPYQYGIDAVLRAIDKRYGGLWSWTLAIELTDSPEDSRIYAIKGPDYPLYYTGIEGDTRLYAEVLRIAYNLLDSDRWQSWVDSIKEKAGK